MRIGTEYLTPTGWTKSPAGNTIGCINESTYKLEWKYCNSIVDHGPQTLYQIKAGKTLHYCGRPDSQPLFYCNRTKNHPVSNLLYRWNNNSVVVHGKHLTAIDHEGAEDNGICSIELRAIALGLTCGTFSFSGAWLLPSRKIGVSDYKFLLAIGAKKSPNKQFLSLDLKYFDSLDSLYSISSHDADKLFELIKAHPSTEPRPSHWTIRTNHPNHVQIIAALAGYTTNITKGKLKVYTKSPNISLKRGVSVEVFIDNSIHPQKLSNYITRYKGCITTIHKG